MINKGTNDASLGKSTIIPLDKYIGKNIEYTVWCENTTAYILVLNKSDFSVKSSILLPTTNTTYTNTYICLKALDL